MTTTAMHQTLNIEIDLLGGLRIRVQDQEMPAPTGKPQQLLAYLLLHPHTAHPRETLAELLWPEIPPARSRRNLSDTLYRLRQLVPGPWLEIDPTTIGLRVKRVGGTGSPTDVTTHNRLDNRTDSAMTDTTVDVQVNMQVDVWAFEQIVACETSDDLAHAVALYRAALLPDLYDDWIAPHRLALQEKYLSALLRLAACQEQSGALEDAHQTLLRALQTDPLREEAHRGLMRVLAKLNRLPDALNAYERLVDLLEREVAAPPAPATRALADALFRELELVRRPTPSLPDDLWRPRFVGRQRERGEMLAAIEGAIRGQGCVIAVDGPAGIGKTRLLEEVAAGAQWRGATVVWGRAGERPAASSLVPLIDAVGAALVGPRAAQVETLLDAETLAGLESLHKPWRAWGPPLELPPEQAQTRFLNLVTTLFATLTELSPLVVMLDDLHCADPTLWFLLDGLVAQSHAMPLALVCSYRRDEIEAGPGWAYLQKWEREKLAQMYPLLPLAQADVSALLGPEQAAQIEAVWAGSGGNPFYVVQALAALAAGDAPHTRITPARTADLSPAARTALDQAAVMGRVIPYSLLAACVSIPPRALIDAAAELVDRHLIEPMENGYRFTHDLVQAAVYDEIEPTRQQALHSRTAQVLAAREPANLRSRAYHLEQSGQLAAAGEAYAEVARQETARFAYAEAQAALIKALGYLPATVSIRRTELLLELARLSNIGGDVERTAVALQDALPATQALDRPDLEVTTRIQMADLAGRTGKHEEAETEFDAAWALAVSAEDDRSQLAVLLPRSDFLSRIGKFEDAKANFAQAITLARALGDKDREGRALEGMGWVLAGLGAPADTVIAYMEQALVAHEEGGNRFEEARTRINLFSALQNAGMWDRLVALEKPMLEGVRRVGYRRGQASAQQAICWMHLGLGDFEAARQAGLQAHALFEEIGEFMGASLAISALGAVLVQEGRRQEGQRYLEQALGITKELGSDAFEAYAHHELGAFFLVEAQADAAKYGDAHEQFQEAVDRWQRIGDPFNLIRSQTRLAQAKLGFGQSADATALAEAAWKYLQSGIPNSNLTLDWLLALYELAQTLNWAARARALIQQAYNELLRQAAQIVDGDVRRRFLENVPVNRSIIALYDVAFAVERIVILRLARSTAPLGRALTPDELTDVVWTVRAPEDEAIGDRTARRRYVLQRLNREADAQDALPTDDDLAQALDVSRRTILRDIQALAEAGIHIRTRARQPKVE